MSMPNEALQKLMQEIEARVISSQQQLQIVKSQMAGKHRDIRLLQLTSRELDKLPPSTKVYEGVGKMFVLEELSDIQKRLGDEKKSSEGDIKDLEKKFRYLETTHEKAQDNFNQILKRGR